MEEHSLRNIFRSQGDSGSNLSEDLSIQTRSIPNAKMFDGNFQLLDELHQSCNLTDQKEAVATSLLSEEERNLGNWSYDGMSQMTSY